MSRSGDWRASLAWAAQNRDLLTPRAYAGFVLVRASLEARRAGDWSAFGRLVAEAFRGGRPTLACFAAHALIWLVPRDVRFSIGERVGRMLPRPAPSR